MGREREEEYQTDEFKQDKDIYENIEINTNSNVCPQDHSCRDDVTLVAGIDIGKQKEKQYRADNLFLQYCT